MTLSNSSPVIPSGIIGSFEKSLLIGRRSSFLLLSSERSPRRSPLGLKAALFGRENERFSPSLLSGRGRRGLNSPSLPSMRGRRALNSPSRAGRSERGRSERSLLFGFEFRESGREFGREEFLLEFFELPEFRLGRSEEPEAPPDDRVHAAAASDRPRRGWTSADRRAA